MHVFFFFTGSVISGVHTFSGVHDVQGIVLKAAESDRLPTLPYEILGDLKVMFIYAD